MCYVSDLIWHYSTVNVLANEKEPKTTIEINKDIKIPYNVLEDAQNVLTLFSCPLLICHKGFLLAIQL